MKCGGDCSALRDGGEPVLQIPVLDLKKRIEAAEKLGAEARQIKRLKVSFFLQHYPVLREQLSK